MSEEIYVSIPVHENIEVVIDQCKNMLKYLHNPRVILHVSRKANFDKDKLGTKIKEEKLNNNIFVNPKSVETGWGSIIEAHLANIEFARQMADDPRSAKFVFHSSNDLIVKQGVADFIKSNKNAFHIRRYDYPGYWWVANVAQRDPCLRKMLTYVSGVARIYGSQIEGAFYNLENLLEISNIIRRFYSFSPGELFYTREEIFFPSVALALKIAPTASPYVFSEVHRFDRMLWHIYANIDKCRCASNESLKHFINETLLKLKFMWKITQTDIVRIRSNKDIGFEIYDANFLWAPYPESTNLYAVKRVPRKINDKLRDYIRQLDL